jgi:Na+/proline symporter
MTLQVIDFLIIGVFLAVTVFMGAFLRKRAQKSKQIYLLGGNDLPWYALGLSNASGMFDISGTMWLVTLGFTYGFECVKVVLVAV